jgi:hypothetical protein
MTSKEAYDLSEQGMQKLHALLLEGKSQTTEYENVCDNLDTLWRYMDKKGKEKITQLSIDLYKESDEIFFERFDPCI